MQETARRNTRQKAAIERAVLSSCDHPSAETVYERAREELPAVSLGTVYRVLRALVEQGSVREIYVPGAPARFDKTTKGHAHFVCSGCGRVEDVFADEDAFERLVKEQCDGCRVDETDIIFRGLCADCRGINL